ncbi:MAG: methyltransferase domain-containing protein [Deltaproteobacteria bacterium]|nr:MAG: methyltransferase domain-containing protein [Deltaproteobacteria bacterium]
MQLDDVAKNYGALARFYDLGDRWLTRPFARIGRLRVASVGRLSLREGDSVLDIGCGTGLNLPLLVEAVGPTGRVVGLDYSEGMLREARRRVESNGWGNVELVHGDAALLEGVGGPFDAAMSTWALGIVDDLPSALERAVDVLKPRGRLAILDFRSTQAERGLRRRLVDPVLHKVLLWSGIDTAEDLDNERFQKRWEDGKRYLREALVDVEEESNVGGTGFLLWGTKP